MVNKIARQSAISIETKRKTETLELQMLTLIERYDAETLDKELFFARAFGPDIHENAPIWLELLEEEDKRRNSDTE